MTVARFFRPIGYLLILVLTVAPLFMLVHQVSNRVDAAEQRESQAFASSEQARSAVDKLAKQVTALGGDPVVEPSEIAKAPVPQSSSGVTSAMVREAVQEYCAAGACDGRRPTLAQVASALTQYCSGGACRGATGKAGVAGKPGANPTSEQIAQAVADYCASGVCKGDPGKDGAAGKDGSNGLDGKNGTDGKDGAQGPAGPKGDPGVDGAPGPAGSVTPGDYGCPSGEYVTGIHVGADGSMSLSCGGVLAAPAPEPAQ